MKFLEAITNVFRVPDLRKRLLFALALLAVYRLGGHIPTPGIDTNKLEEFFRQNQGTLFGYLDVFSGGSFRRLTIFALGIMPYITSSIILQLLTVVVPTLEKLQKEGELGRRKITQWTRYLTVLLGGLQTSFVAHWLQINGVGAPTWGFLFTTVLTLTTGTIFVMWLGEQITERGVGNGISLLIFAGIVIGRKGRGINETFTVRRISYGEGVERVFPLHSPRIAKVEVEKEGRARRAALNYLRKRKGKEATAVREQN